MNAHGLSNHPADNASGSAGRIRLPMAAASLIAALVVACLAGASSSHATPTATESVSPMLSHAHAIGANVSTRARLLPGVKLKITDPTPTSVIESFTLLAEDFLESRYVSAEHGVWYSICPVRAFCPSPAPRFTRPAADYVARRMALELAFRTFLETDASVVAVSLPTPRRVAFVVERDELTREVDVTGLSKALSDEPLLHPEPPAELRRAVDELTLPRIFVFVGFEPGVQGGPSWAGIPRWPVGR